MAPQPRWEFININPSTYNLTSLSFTRQKEQPGITCMADEFKNKNFICGVPEVPVASISIYRADVYFGLVIILPPQLLHDHTIERRLTTSLRRFNSSSQTTLAAAKCDINEEFDECLFEFVQRQHAYSMTFNCTFLCLRMSLNKLASYNRGSYRCRWCQIGQPLSCPLQTDWG